MENASKALIIAGAVLIAIILIGFGVKVLLTAKNSPEQVDQASQSLSTSMFNSQFESYFGTNVSAKQTRALISKIIVNNSQNSDHKIMVYFRDINNSEYTHNSSLTNLQNINNVLADNHLYNISISSSCSKFTGGYDNGYVACISIVEH